MRRAIPLVVAAVLYLAPPARANFGPYALAYINYGNNYLLAAFNADPITDVTIATSFQYAQGAQQLATAARATGSRTYWAYASQYAAAVYVYALQDYQANPRNTAAAYAAIYYYYGAIYANYAAHGY